MKLKYSKWLLSVLGIAAIMIPAAVVWASPPNSGLSADVVPLAGTPGSYNNADKVDWHHAGPSTGTVAQRKNRVLWAQSNGKLHWKAMPSASLNVKYLNDDRKETLSANVVGTLLSVNNSGTGANVYGIYANGEDKGVYGHSSSGNGVYGYSSSNKGVAGNSSSGYGVYGESSTGRGVFGISTSNTGVFGSSSNGYGVQGHSISGVGVRASSATNHLLEAWDTSPTTDRMFYVANNGNVWAKGAYSGTGADFAEMLPAVDGLEPGDVLVIGVDGKLKKSASPNAGNVAGVYSTQPGFLGGNSDDDDHTGKVPVAIVGVAPVKVSAENGAINPGDLLTTSSIPGHAMKADRPAEPGTILGKALESLEDGTGVIIVLITLH